MEKGEVAGRGGCGEARSLEALLVLLVARQSLGHIIIWRCACSRKSKSTPEARLVLRGASTEANPDAASHYSHFHLLKYPGESLFIDCVCGAY